MALRWERGARTGLDSKQIVNDFWIYSVGLKNGYMDVINSQNNCYYCQGKWKYSYMGPPWESIFVTYALEIKLFEIMKLYSV